MNNLLLILAVVGTFTLMLLVKKLFKKEGLIAWIGIASILANLILTKSVNLLGLSATLGNVLFASNFLATDMLTENYGYKEAKKGVKIGIFAVIFFAVVTQFALLFTPSSEDFAQSSFETLFAFIPRISLASILMYAVSNFVDIKLYEFLRKKTNGKKMWLRNNLCTIICNGCENFIFYLIAFSGTMDLKTIFTMGISATIIEILIALCDTPFLYLSKKIKD